MNFTDVAEMFGNKFIEIKALQEKRRDITANGERAARLARQDLRSVSSANKTLVHQAFYLRLRVFEARYSL